MRKAFLLYTDNLNVLDVLTDEQAGVLFRAIRAKVTGAEMPEMDGMTTVAFYGIEAALERDMQKYEGICEKRRAAGKKGGIARASNCLQMLTNDSKSKQVQATQADNKNDNKNDNNINSKGKPTKRFVPPTVEQVAEYCREKGYNIDPQDFVDFYQSKGWKIGKDSMKDWKASVRTWASRDKKRQTARATGNRFNQFEQNQYDFDKLEKDLGIV